jgi:hypothetical protein
MRQFLSCVTSLNLASPHTQRGLSIAAMVGLLDNLLGPMSPTFPISSAVASKEEIP